MVEASPESPFLETCVQADCVLRSVGLSGLRRLSCSESCALRGLQICARISQLV
jgi:hypothetical protein